MTGSFFRSLRSELRGEVLDDSGTRAAYAWDASNHRVVPLAVALPHDADDLAHLVRRCVDAGIPLTPRGGGTSIAGNAIGPGVVVDFSRHMRDVVEIDPDSRTAVVQPGLVLDDLHRRIAAYGLIFGVDPSTHDRCTLGGMIGNNSCGSHSVAWGTTADNVDSVEILLPDGDHITLGRGPTDRVERELATICDTYQVDIRRELGRFPRQISGYGLHHLLPERGSDVARAFVGSEGTCGILTAARIRLIRPPAVRALLVAGFADDLAAAAAAPQLAKLGPLTVEGMGSEIVHAFDARPGPHRRPELPRGDAWLLIEAGGDDAAAARESAELCASAARDCGAWDTRLFTAPRDMAACWRIRERGAGLATRTAAGQERWPGWEDAAVPPERLSEYLRDFRALLDRYGRHGVLFGHFGEGCVHVRIDHDLLTTSGRAAYRSFQQDAADLVVSHDGSLSGEHGDGRARAELLPRMYGERVLKAFAAFKHAFDPENVLNPGVLVDPRPLDADFRLSLTRPQPIRLGLPLAADDGDIGKALRRCVGVAACRKESGGGMCPSFRATRDERHSTRGRARILAEMLDGSLVSDGWRSKSVKQALDLCLGCKACRSECPVGVDMATYKTEFLYQHYRGRLRPASHLSMGWAPLWLAIARRMPKLANLLLSVPGLEALAKRLCGIDPRRRLPRFAESSARMWFRRRVSRSAGDPVVLWLDSFTVSFAPDIVRDAVEVLELAGYRVELAPRRLCCGLPWLSTGQVGIARRVMRRTVRLLGAGDQTRPVVVLEPSCGVALRTDLPELLGSESARRLAGRIRTLAELLGDRRLHLEKVQQVDAVVQFHCHQRAVTGVDSDRALLKTVGVTVHSADEGCCGMAGNFGLERGHYEVSKACAGQSFMPLLPSYGDSTFVVADGFSCRVQIADFGGRAPIHLAQLLRRRLKDR